MRRMRSLTAFLFAFLLVPALVLAADPQSGKPMYGTIGFDGAGADRATRPGNDFFRFANGTWVDRTEIPADKSIYSLRVVMSDMVEQRLHAMMEDAAAKSSHAPTTLEGKVGAFYKSFMDENGLNT